MAFSGGTSGQWVRANNDDNAKIFLAEQEQEQRQLLDRSVRAARFRQRVASRLRAWFRRDDR